MIAIRPYREKAGLTQASLAKMMGITQSAITMWESGDRKPNIIQLKKLARILSCTADDLLKPVREEGGTPDVLQAERPNRRK